MHQVTSPTCTTTNRPHRAHPWLLRPLIAALAIGLSVTLVAPAGADDLNDKRDHVRKAIVASKHDVAESKAEMTAAVARLSKAQEALAKAQRTLTAATVAVDDAKAVEAAIGVRLDRARRKLAQAKRAVAEAKAAVDAQLALMGQAAREAYQKQTDLVGLSVVFESADTGDLSQRLQWSTTIFDATSAQMARLRALKTSLVAAQQAQAEIERQIAADKAEAAANVERLKVLQGRAATAKATVAAMVTRTAAAKKDAAGDLKAEQEEYDGLQAQEATISAEIKRRAEIARKKRLADEARRRAAAKKAHKVYVPRHESTKGFIRPVAASPGSPFGLRFHPILHVWRMHRGQDFGAACGLPIYAAADGRVASAAWQGGFGNYVVIDHGFVRGKYVSTGYAHQRRMVVHRGQRVRQGQLIGYVGTTGLSTGCHLHLQVYVNGGVVNPMNWVP